MKIKFWGPPQKPILGGQKPKWAISPRRVCSTVLKFCMGSQVTKILGIQRKRYLGNPPYTPINPILTGKRGNLVKSTLQTCVP